MTKRLTPTFNAPYTRAARPAIVFEPKPPHHNGSVPDCARCQHATREGALVVHVMGRP